MSREIKYIGGSKDGRTRRVRSIGEQKATEVSVWREFDKTTKQPTGRERRETYRLDRERCEYILDTSDVGRGQRIGTASGPSLP